MIKLLATLLISVSLGFASGLPLPKAATNYKMDYTKETICLVRHFKVYKDPKWVSKILNPRDEKSKPKNIGYKIETITKVLCFIESKI